MSGGQMSGGGRRTVALKDNAAQPQQPSPSSSDHGDDRLVEAAAVSAGAVPFRLRATILADASLSADNHQLALLYSQRGVRENERNNSKTLNFITHSFLHFENIVNRRMC